MSFKKEKFPGKANKNVCVVCASAIETTMPVKNVEDRVIARPCGHIQVVRERLNA